MLNIKLAGRSIFRKLMGQLTGAPHDLEKVWTERHFLTHFPGAVPVPVVPAQAPAPRLPKRDGFKRPRRRSDVD